MKKLYLEKSLGLDIREESVAITLLGKTLRKVQIIDFDFFRISPLSSDDEKSESIFLERINSFLMKIDVWPQNLAVSLPRSHYSFQSFELPAPNLKTAESMIGFELERHFSSNIDDLYFGTHTCKVKDNLFHVMSAGIKKGTVDYYLELLGRLNLKPTIVDVPTFANANLVLSQSKDMPPLCAMIDIGPQGIELSLLKDRHVHFSKTVPFADPDFMSGFFQNDLNDSYYESMSIGLSKIVVEELQNALESSRDIDESEAVEIIYLVGAGPYHSFLAKQIQMETEVTTSRVRIPSTVEAFSSQILSTAYITTSISLGLREIKPHEIEANLLHPDLKPKKRKSSIKTTIGLATAAVVLLVGLFVNTILQQNVTLASLDQQLREVKNQVKSLQEIDQEHEYLGGFVETLNTIEQNYPSKLPVLADLSKTLSNDTWLTRIKIAKNNMEISGYSKTASRLVPVIEKSPHFKETRFVGSITKDKEGEKFTIKTILQATP